jgi:hypothetical protein
MLMPFTRVGTSRPSVGLDHFLVFSGSPKSAPELPAPEHLEPSSLPAEDRCRGDGLALCSDDELEDDTIQVMDLAGGDNLLRAGGHGMAQSDLLVINKTDLTDAVGADLAVLEPDTHKIRGTGPYVFSMSGKTA